MTDCHRQGQIMDPESWRTRLNYLLTSIETFDAYRQARSAEDVGKWQTVTDWALMSQGGHNTGPHTDSHGMGTWITVSSTCKHLMSLLVVGPQEEARCRTWTTGSAGTTSLPATHFLAWALGVVLSQLIIAASGLWHPVKHSLLLCGHNGETTKWPLGLAKPYLDLNSNEVLLAWVGEVSSTVSPTQPSTEHRYRPSTSTMSLPC
ncbi:uncharacterized protein FMAN_00313 [Fusarium mangiferae]|uniref:Uncharacterized protein n=1 Tax=Fusarium mangiferae TaxID=192010 RepID=A0A1L7TWC9_FUSMA|nr:uncharacterized protein FMAN_00313 [Fusarium mangiferae]CVL02888.1 uncharacterized protein FMAN_00313 [Fusarium mangiferae]